MGFTLGIGEFEPKITPEERHVGAFVEGRSLKAAPLNSNYPEGDHWNTIDPSYGSFHNFARATGLYSVFFAPRCACDIPPSSCGCGTKWWIRPDGEEDDGLLRRHPGAAELTEQHLIEFRGARERYLGTEEPRAGVGDDGTDWVLRRLDWLCWWTEWALEHCEYPTFGNY